MLKAVIFDFDGVIADTEPLHYISTEQTLSKYGIELSQEDFYNKYLGYSDHDFFEIYKGLYPEELAKVSVEELMQLKTDLQLELVKGRNVVIKHVPGFVKRLIAHNIPIAICSGGRRREIEQILVKGRLMKFFDIIVSADEVAVGKPDPQGFLLALQMLSLNHPGRSIESQDCVVIEDSRWGLEAAKKAGMHTVAVTTSYSADELSAADLIVNNLDSLGIDDLLELCK